jgi:hypothetical protein
LEDGGVFFKFEMVENGIVWNYMGSNSSENSQNGVAYHWNRLWGVQFFSIGLAFLVSKQDLFDNVEHGTISTYVVFFSFFSKRHDLEQLLTYHAT